MNTSYQEFLSSKSKQINQQGITISGSELNKNMFDFQKYVTARALKFGKHAIFSECGTGKSLMQLEWGNIVSQKTNKPALILAPLAVSDQTIEEGEKFGIDITKTGTSCRLQISNYEQLDNIDLHKYGSIILDESSILKNFEGKIKSKIISVFNHVPYKLCCTATPSPNDFTELGNHAEFLNVCSRLEMLSKYFVHDGGETSKWYLKGHAKDVFWKWVSSWAIMLANPSDIGFDGSKYVLPQINYINHLITTKQRANGKLFNDISINATNFNQELRLTKEERLNTAAQIALATNENIIIWIKQNEEADYLRKLIPDAVEVRGTETSEIKSEKLLGFAKNKFRVLITKGKIGRYGMNYQNCHNEIFASPDFSFETIYQCVRRVYRFGQKHPVNIHLITTDTMQNIIQVIKNKEAQFQLMREHFKKIYKNEEIISVN